MRVLQVTGAYPPTIGGGPNMVRDFTSHLRARGHHVSVVTTDPGDGTLGDPAVYRAGAKSVAGAPVAPTFPLVLNRAVAEVDPDVVHSYYPLPFYPDAGAIGAAMSGVPHVLTCFGAWESTFRSVLGTLGFAYNKTLLRLTLRLTDAPHTLSTGVLSEIDTYRGYEDRFTIIPPGVDTTEFDPSRVQAAAPFDDRDEPVVLFVGVLRRYKGLDVLVNAFERLRRDVDARLVVIGEGPKERELRDAIARHNLGGHVDLLGHVSREQLLAAYEAADLFVLPSPSIRESFGIVVSEALAMGTPVVVSGGCGAGHFLAGTDVGTVVEPGDPAALARGLASLLTDEGRYERERAAARPFATDHLAWDGLVDEYEALYRSALP